MEVERPIRDFIEEFKEPYKSQILGAIDNGIKLGKDSRTKEFIFSIMVNSHHDAMNQAFTWSHSPQGHPYWSEIREYLKHNRNVEEYIDIYRNREIIIPAY